MDDSDGACRVGWCFRPGGGPAGGAIGSGATHVTAAVVSCIFRARRGAAGDAVIISGICRRGCAGIRSADAAGIVGGGRTPDRRAGISECASRRPGDRPRDASARSVAVGHVHAGRHRREGGDGRPCLRVVVTWTVWLAKGVELAGAKRNARSATRKLA